ncbi:MAG: ABC transporter permease [bacterium]|nr:ABC transporter permease [bacterium]MDE0289702.1 ABC transporter permease [bacterium]MDE0440157.1 ABC transporter permease [bacterium]
MTDLTGEPPRMDDSVSSAAGVLVRKRRRDRVVAWLQLLPGSAFFIAFFLLPLLGLLAMSFFSLVDFEPVVDFTISNYAEVLTSSVHARLALRTVQAATIVTAIVLIVSFPFAYTLNFVFRKHRQILFFLVLVSLFGGYIVRIYAWRSILGNQGVINQGLMALSIVDEPVRQLLNSMYAVGASLVNFLIPLGVLPIYAAMQNVSPGLAEAARDLGASRIRAARQIVLPLSMRGVRAAAAFVFIATLGEWVTPRLLGGTEDLLIGNRIEYYFGSSLEWPAGAALAITLIVGMGVAAYAIMTLMKRLAR